MLDSTMAGSKRQQIIYYYLLGWKAREIAQRVGTTPQYVYNTLNWARRKGLLKPHRDVKAVVRELAKAKGCIEQALVKIGVMGMVDAREIHPELKETKEILDKVLPAVRVLAENMEVLKLWRRE